MAHHSPVAGQRQIVAPWQAKVLGDALCRSLGR
jgi:hypothetical protein